MAIHFLTQYRDGCDESANVLVLGVYLLLFYQVIPQIDPLNHKCILMIKRRHDYATGRVYTMWEKRYWQYSCLS